MSMLLMLLMGSKANAYVPTIYTKTFAANGSFIIPAGVTVLDMVEGRGAAGSPASSASYTKRTITYLTRRDTGQVEEVDGGAVFGGFGNAPGDYCDPPDTSSGSTVYSSIQQCYHFVQTGGDQATTGASANGFGKVFPGGYAGPAQAGAYQNVAVTAGAPYAVVVPFGGYIKITYKA